MLLGADSLAATFSEIINKANMTIEERELYVNNLRKYDEFEFLSR